MTEDTQPADGPPGFHLLAKPTGSTCNIDCTYCFFLSKAALHPVAALGALPPGHPLAVLLRDAPDFRHEAALADALLHRTTSRTRCPSCSTSSRTPA